MSIVIKTKAYITAKRDDKEFEFLVPDGVTSYTLAYDAIMEIANKIFEEMQKQKDKNNEAVKENNPQEKDTK